MAMTDKEILQKAIEKAVENGYKLPHEICFDMFGAERDLKMLFGEKAKKEDMYWRNKDAVIFSHSFAKAFWGEEEAVVNATYGDDGCWVCGYDGVIGMFPYNTFQNWQMHLQKMVLEENPIKYLEKWL